MTVLWTTTNLPGPAWDPEPDDDTDDGPWCEPGLLPEQRDRTTTITVSEEYL